MTTEESEGNHNGIRRDKMGRVQTSRERREALLDEFEKSGMTRSTFASHVGVKERTLGEWLYQRRRTTSGKKKAVETDKPAKPLPVTQSVRWVEAVVQGGSVGTALSMLLPSGVRMEVSDSHGVALAVEVLKQLQSPRAAGC